MLNIESVNSKKGTKDRVKYTRNFYDSRKENKWDIKLKKPKEILEYGVKSH